MTPQEFLVWLTTSAGYSAAFAFIAERIPAFQKLTPGQKQLATLAGPLAIALGAYAALTYIPPATLEAIKPIFLLVSTVIGSWITGQLAHKADPAS
jgi:membrane-associated protease RseP (regulator of RpoE activity)